MLWYKSWLETRTRFFIGIALVAAACAFFVFGNPMIVAQWKSDQILHPEYYDPPWLMQAIEDYSFFLWHFLSAAFLQQIWVLFALLLSFGGIAREATQGAAGFSLSFPVSRRRMIAIRSAVGAAELVVLAFTSVLLIPLFSVLIGKSYSMQQAALHCGLLCVAGMVTYMLGIFLSTAIRGEYTPVLVGISSAALLYFFIQPYADGSAPEPRLIRCINLPGVLAGPPEISSLAAIPWMGLMASMILATALFWAALALTDKRDF